MSEAITASSEPREPGSHEHGEHPPFLAHHFDTPQQQFDTGKLGTWLFLVTEILFFSGLFVFYAVYRSNHPEVFVDAHQYLDKSLGAVNTIVLLFSSLTMAWGVRCAQLGQRKGLVTCLAITLACASLFLGIKAVEYTHKWDMGLFWGASFAPSEHGPHHGISRGLIYLCVPAALLFVWSGISAAVARARGDQHRWLVAICLVLTAVAFFAGVGLGFAIPAVQAAVLPGHAAHADAAHAAGQGHASEGLPAGTAAAEASGPGAADPDASREEGGSEPAATQSASDAAAAADAAAATGTATAAGGQPSLTAVFFSIYYSITGLHAVHILAGMVVITWLLGRAVKGHFNAEYFGPVDYVGLYWHLVDLIWIFLFPLLYLIH